MELKLNKYWFKPKKYGYGATPTSWEGWTITAIFILFLVYRANSLIEIDPGRFYFEVFISVLVLISICKAKTDGDWKWRWG